MKMFPSLTGLVAGLALVGLSGCTTSRHAGPILASSSALRPQPAAERILWPAEYEPAQAVFHVQNEIEINAPPEVVWDVLVRAETWPQWYEGAAKLSLRDAPGGRLAPGAAISWRTMGLNLESRVREFEPPHRLAWESRKAVIRGYHAWLVIPTVDGCRVVTEESFHGFLAYLQRLFIPKKLHGLHETWLVELKRKAEKQVRDLAGQAPEVRRDTVVR